jgi:hypothetical protein
MPSIPNVVRRGAIYYWRRRVPAALAESRKSATLLLGRTSDSRRARFLAPQIAALVDLQFFPAVMTQRVTQQQLQRIFREVFTRHLDKFDAGRRANAWRRISTPSRAGEPIGSWVGSIVFSRREALRPDGRARDQMLADGMTEPEIAATARMLELMQRQKVAAEPPGRLRALVEKVDGEPNPIDLAMAQETIYRAMAEANFQTPRRHDVAVIARTDTDDRPARRVRSEPVRRWTVFVEIIFTLIDPDDSWRRTGANRRLEPAYKQHAVGDDVRGVVLDVAVTTGKIKEGRSSSSGSTRQPRRRACRSRR